LIALAKSSTEIPRDAIAEGSALILIADLVPKMFTRLTPGRMLIRWPTCVLAKS